MTNVTKLERKYSNQPNNGWLWIHDHPPELVRRYFLISAITEWFYWHCVINNNQSAVVSDHNCDFGRAYELAECLCDLTAGEIEDSGFLTDVLWAQLDYSALHLLMQGAVWSDKSIIEACASLFSWSAESDEHKVVLENYVDEIVCKRSHVFNEGSYHDSMNWLDIYDMELNDAYRHWVESKHPNLKWEISNKLKRIKRYMAYPLEGQIKRQWSCEALYLGLTENQADSHWRLLREYLQRKIGYHKSRIEQIESAIDSPFTPRRVQPRTKNSIYKFGLVAVNYFEERMELFRRDIPFQLELF